MSRNLKRNMAAVCLITAAFAVTACGPRMMVNSTTPLPADAPSADVARIYFVSPTPPAPYRSGSAYVWDGGTLLGMISNKQVIISEVAPGRHIFLAQAQNLAAIDANLEGGKSYYIKVDYAPGFSTNSVVFYPVTPATEEWAVRHEWVNGCRFMHYNPEGGLRYETRNGPKNAARAAEIEGGKGEAKPLLPTDGD